MKGRLLDEQSTSDVIALLARYRVLFEAAAVELCQDDDALIARHQTEQARRITANLTPAYSLGLRSDLMNLRQQLEAMSAQLYVQSTLNQEVIAAVIEQQLMYYAQRLPKELGSFHWVIDAKAPKGITPWETWWSTTVRPLLQSRSLRRPTIGLREADYSHFERYRTTLPEHLKPLAKYPEEPGAINLNLLLTEHFRFSALPEPGLELVDILVSATRRALTGNLSRAGWRRLPRLMIHRRHQYIHLMTFNAARAGRARPCFSVLRHFQTGGRPILAPRFARKREE